MHTVAAAVVVVVVVVALSLIVRALRSLQARPICCCERVKALLHRLWRSGGSWRVARYGESVRALSALCARLTSAQPVAPLCARAAAGRNEQQGRANGFFAAAAAAAAATLMRQTSSRPLARSLLRRTMGTRTHMH